MKYIFVITLLFFGKLSFADFYFPTNMRGFDASQNLELNSASRYDSESESDYLTFSPIPCKHLYIMKQEPSIFCGTVGSISSKRFLIDNLTLLTKPLNKNSTFRFQWLKDQNYTQDTDAALIEFLFTKLDNHSFGIHGQLDTEKAEDDAGVSYNYSNDNFFSRLEVTALDFSRNKRNENDDSFKEDPYVASLSFLKTKAEQNYYINFHYEPEWVWNRLNPSQVLTRQSYWIDSFLQYQEYYYSIEFRKTRIEVDMNYQKRENLRNHLQYEKGHFLSGLRWVRKKWSQSEKELTHYDLLPFLWYRPPGDWHIGYEANWHRSIGDMSLSSNADKSSAIEHRLNLAWLLLNEKNASFKLLFTFDADSIVEETWEGGNGQFTMYF